MNRTREETMFLCHWIMIFFKISSASLCLSDTKITKVFFRLLGGRHSQYLWHLLKMLTDKMKLLNCFSHTSLVSKTLFLVTLFSQWDFYLNLLLTRKSSLDTKTSATKTFSVCSHANFGLVWVFHWLFS